MAMLPIKYVTIHCAATPEGRDVKAHTINEWDIAKFGQVSYHLVIELDGTVVRSLKDSQRGAHVGRNNSHNIGICYVGGMDHLMHEAKDTRTEAQKRAMRTLIRTFEDRYKGIKVLGHRDWPGVSKACPSFDVQEWLDAGMPVGDGNGS